MSAAPAFEPNWIDYRHSLVQVDKRRDADDATLEICAHCECEVDLDPAPHKPGCRGIGAARVATAPVLAAVTPAARPDTARARPVEGLDLLERMDAGERLTPSSSSGSSTGAEEPEGLEEAAAERLGPDGAASSSPEPVLGEVAAVGERAASGPAEAASDAPDGLSGEPERAATSPSNPYGLKKFGRGYIWTRQQALQAIKDYAAATGRPPRKEDSRKEPTGTLPSIKSAERIFGTWEAMVTEAGFDPLTRRVLGDTAKAQPRSKTLGWIKVDGTGLAYRTPDEAYVAADEIEADGERVAASARFDGNDAKAEQAVDAARELAEKIRVAARGAEDREREPRDIHEPDGAADAPATPNVEASPTPGTDIPAVSSRSEHHAELELVAAPPGLAQEWIAKLHAEAARLDRRAAAFRLLIEGLTELDETAA